MHYGAIKKFGYETLDKKSGSSSKMAKHMNMHKNYDYVIAPGHETAKHYSECFNIEIEKIKIIGMPRIDYILEEDIEKEEKIQSRYSKLKNKKNVLYVPTFRKDKMNDMNQVYEKFDFDNYNLVVKYHPLDKSIKNIINPVNDKAIAIYDEDINIYDLYKLCDIIITDYSSASLEASLLHKPIYFYVYDIDDYIDDPGLNVDLFKEMPNCTSKSFDEIMNWIKEDKYNIEWVKNYKSKYFNIDFNNSCTENLLNFITTEE
jgi:CDP-ribitol ribitolphosphotransferase